MLISSDSNWPVKGSQWGKIVSDDNSYFYADIFMRCYEKSEIDSIQKTWRIVLQRLFQPIVRIVEAEKVGDI